MIPFGWSDPTALHFADDPDSAGRVVTSHRGMSDVATWFGIVNLAHRGPQPAVGDWVRITDGVITEVVDRSSELRRSDATETGDQILAANADYCLVVLAVDQEMSAERVERTMVMVWDGGVTPLLAINKIDLASDEELEAAMALAHGAAPGVEVFLVSAKTGHGVPEILQRMTGRTVALLGLSGAGKSTLVNTMVGEHVVETAEVREVDGKGRHTTVTRDLIPIQSGIVLIDTPGLRSFGLPSGGLGVELAFADIEALAAMCRFRDCSHTSEPGCAVTEQVDARRVESYRKLLREQDYMEQRAVERDRRSNRRAGPRR